MIHATLSLPGLYIYDNTVLDNLQLPEALNRETVIDNLLLDTVELELLYPDADMMKQAVGFWSKKRLPIWQKLYDTTVLEYNPIWNVDGTTREERTIDQTRQYSENGSDTRNGSDNRTGTGTERTTGSAESESDQETAGNTLNKSNTFNSGSMIDNEKTETDGTGRTTASGTTESNTTRTDTDNATRTETGSSEKSGDETGNTKEILETERHGNIGVTTTQQMIREEREVAEFDVIQYIINDFKSRFCLLVY